MQEIQLKMEWQAPVRLLSQFCQLSQPRRQAPVQLILERQKLLCWVQLQKVHMGMVRMISLFLQQRQWEMPVLCLRVAASQQ